MAFKPLPDPHRSRASINPISFAPLDPKSSLHPSGKDNGYGDINAHVLMAKVCGIHNGIYFDITFILCICPYVEELTPAYKSRVEESQRIEMRTERNMTGFASAIAVIPDVLREARDSNRAMHCRDIHECRTCEGDSECCSESAGHDDWPPRGWGYDYPARDETIVDLERHNVPLYDRLCRILDEWVHVVILDTVERGCNIPLRYHTTTRVQVSWCPRDVGRLQQLFE